VSQRLSVSQRVSQSVSQSVT